MANWFGVKRDGNRVRLSSGGGFDLVTSDDARIVASICRNYGIYSALGGVLWTVVIATAVYKGHEWWWNRKMKKEKLKENEEA